MAEMNDSSGKNEIITPSTEYSVTSAEATIPVVTLDVNKGKPIRLQVKVMVPVNDHPNYNFVGKLLGPKGNSLKWLQEQTQTKMAILGKGSMRNKEKEKELRELNDPKYSHLNEDLHVEITAYAQAAEAYLRISKALFEIKRFLVPDYYDDIRKQQLRELGVIGRDRPEIVHYPSDLTYPTIAPVGLIVPENAKIQNDSITFLRDLATSSLSCLTQRMSAVSELPLDSYSALEFNHKNNNEGGYAYKHNHKHREEDYYNTTTATTITNNNNNGNHLLLPPFKRKPYSKP